MTDMPSAKFLCAIDNDYVTGLQAIVNGDIGILREADLYSPYGNFVVRADQINERARRGRVEWRRRDDDDVLLGIERRAGC